MRDGGTCTLQHIAKDRATTRIEFYRFTDGRTGISASGAGWSFGKDRSYPVTLSTASRELSSGSCWSTSDLRKGRGGFSMALQTGALARLLAAPTIAVHAPNAAFADVQFDMPAGAGAEQDLERRRTEARRYEAGSGAPAVIPVRTRGPQAFWIVPDDYPGRARREQVSGTVTVRLTVIAYSRVSDCVCSSRREASNSISRPARSTAAAPASIPRATHEARRRSGRSISATNGSRRRPIRRSPRRESLRHATGMARSRVRPHGRSHQGHTGPHVPAAIPGCGS